jgi:hypothetical protein
MVNKMANDKLHEQERKLAKQYAHDKKMGLKDAAKDTKALHRKTATQILKNIKKREKSEKK